MQKIIISLRVFLVLAVLLGLGYPFLIFAVGQLAFPYQANGSLLEENATIIGSTLIAQEFTLPKYFHSRLSFIKYDAADSGASNLAASSDKLIQLAQSQIRQVRKENSLNGNLALPADMVLYSASGLDPHISLANAMIQLPRVAKARKLPEARIKKIIYEHIEPDFIGVWGAAGVNVLKLNIALDDFLE